MFDQVQAVFLAQAADETFVVTQEEEGAAAAPSLDAGVGGQGGGQGNHAHAAQLLRGELPEYPTDALG